MNIVPTHLRNKTRMYLIAPLSVQASQAYDLISLGIKTSRRDRVNHPQEFFVKKEISNTTEFYLWE